MNTRRTLEEEKKLIKDVKNGLDISSLAKELNRSENALELRIKKIIYDSIAGSKSINVISRSLNLPEDKVKQYFYSYKDMMEKKGKNTVDIVENNNNNNNKKDDVLSNIKLHVNEKKDSKGGSRKEHKRDSRKEHKGGSKKENSKEHSRIDLDKLKRQNDKMETILKNVQLKNEIKKALKTNKLDKDEIKIVKDVIH